MRQYLIDAFADRPFKGNPACVLTPFTAWPEDGFLQALAMENNQAETAYLLATDLPDRFGLRWFTPVCEAPLCGHATLASAHVLFNELGHTAEVLYFDTLSGTLTVKRLSDGRLEMDFPAYPPHAIPIPDEIEAVLGVRPVALFGGPALVAQLPDEASVRNCEPDLARLGFYKGELYPTERHIIITALADADSPYAVVSRFFAPGIGIDEDPATGSMHCILAPLYAELTGETVIDYYQAHPRRGAHLQCELIGDRVKLRGHAISIARSELLI